MSPARRDCLAHRRAPDVGLVFGMFALWQARQSRYRAKSVMRSVLVLEMVWAKISCR